MTFAATAPSLRARLARFALAVGALFDAGDLPTGETFLELVDSAIGCGRGWVGVFALSAILGLPTVQSVVPAEVWRFFGAEPAQDYSDDELDAKVRDAIDAAHGMTHPPQVLESQWDETDVD
jgi:hypothetical protein